MAHARRRRDGVRRGASSGAGVEVTLIEDTDGVAQHGPARHEPAQVGSKRDESTGDGVSHGPGRTRRRRRPVLVALGLVGVLLLAGAGSAALERHRDDARRAAFADVRGIVAPLDQPLTERWSVPGWITTTAEDVVLVADHESGTLVAVEPGTGAVRWTRQSLGTQAHVEDCVEADDDPGATPDGAEQPHGLLLCTVDGGMPVNESTESSVALVRVADGTTVARRAFAGATAWHDVVDGDRLVVAVDHGGVVEVVRWDPRAGADVWSWTSPAPVEHDPASGMPFVDVRGGAVVVGDIALDVRTGGSLPVPPTADAHAGDDGVLTELSSGHRVVVRWSGDGNGEVVVEAPDGTVLYELPGWPSTPWLVDDGSRPDLLLVEDEGALSALDPVTGEPVWAVDVHPGHTVLLVDGLLVRNEQADAHGAGGADMVVRDADDGRERWRARSVTASVQTDGALLLLTEQVAPAAGARGSDPLRVPSGGFDTSDATHGALTLVARRLVDGTEVWRAPFRYSEWMHVAPDGTLLVQDGTSVSGWR